MEEALTLLSDGGSPPLAPALQQEIQESLQQLRPQVILDHIKVSLHKTAVHSFSNLALECMGSCGRSNIDMVPLQVWWVGIGVAASHVGTCSLM